MSTEHPISIPSRPTNPPESDLVTCYTCFRETDDGFKCPACHRISCEDCLNDNH